jgi:hypothetical protein
VSGSQERRRVTTSVRLRRGGSITVSSCVIQGVMSASLALASTTVTVTVTADPTRPTHRSGRSGYILLRIALSFLDGSSGWGADSATA